MDSFKVLVQVSRPIGWILGPLVFLIGFFYSGVDNLSPVGFMQAALLSFPFSIILYGINDVYDYESDRLNPRKISALSPDRHILVKKVSLAAAVSLIAASFLTLNPSNILATILLVLLGYFYSAPPLRLKEKPPLDSISNGAIFFIVFAVGWSYGGSILDIPLKIYFVAFCVMGIHAFGTVMDFKADREAGQRTFATLFGKRTASIFAFSVFAASYLFSGIGRQSINYYFIYCGLLCLVSVVYPSERLASTLFKLIFIGFVITGTVFVISYLPLI